MMLIEVMIAAPLIGVAGDAPTVMHCIDMSGIPVETWETATTMTARCGAAVKAVMIQQAPAQWRYLRTRGTPYKRCPVCRTTKAAA